MPAARTVMDRSTYIVPGKTCIWRGVRIALAFKGKLAKALQLHPEDIARNWLRSGVEAYVDCSIPLQDTDIDIVQTLLMEEEISLSIFARCYAGWTQVGADDGLQFLDIVGLQDDRRRRPAGGVSQHLFFSRAILANDQHERVSPSSDLNA